MSRQPLPLPFVLAVWAGVFTVALGQEDAARSWPATEAERTDYRETSRYEDVIEFVGALVAKGAPVSLTNIGTSTSGRRIPMVVAGRPLPADPAVARRSNRPIVCIQANIHAGEVEGKEAALMLLRDLSRSTEPGGLLEKLILVVLPIYNIDGNEQFGPQAMHRPHQFGPEWVGVRSNGQGLDLNRDYVKLEAPETRAAMNHVFKKWDPHVFLDLHATNGTLHGYPLTYAPPLHPDTAKAVLDYTRDELLPEVRKAARDRYGLELFDYGNTPRWSFANKPFAWYASRPEPRYSTNYMGLRNRIGILSEAMSHLAFKDRVEATYRFVELILERVAQDAARVIDITVQADRQVVEWGRSPENAPKLGVRFDFASRGCETVLLDKSETPALRDRQPKDRPPGPPENVVEFETDIVTRFVAIRTRRLPAAYLFGPELANVAELLGMHGVTFEIIREPWQGEVESFRIETMDTREKPYQGHRPVTLEGNFSSSQRSLPVGGYLVPTSQPLGLLLFQLLEPESLDGVAAWNLLDEHLQVGADYPIVKCYDTTICYGEPSPEEARVTLPPPELKLDPFYQKYVSANGYPVISSSKVNDYALKEAAYLIDMMLAKRPGVREAMIEGGSRVAVMAHNEFTTDVPEQREMKPKDFWDARARGLGGSRRDPLCSCAEENLLGYEGDPYSTENILIHEFAHNMHLRGLVNVDPTFDERLKQTYDRAMGAGLWENKYASNAEYFAEGVQSWFDNNREDDHDHNHVNTRTELIEYDPGLAAICEEVFGDTELVYTKPATRLHGHMAGYDPTTAPTFKWPERLHEVQRKIKRDAQRRGSERKKAYTK